MEVRPLPRVPDSHQGVMSAADGLPRKEEDRSAILPTLTILQSDEWRVRGPKIAHLSDPCHSTPDTRHSQGRQADISWLHLSRKQDRRSPRSEHYRRLPPI